MTAAMDCLLCNSLSEVHYPMTTSVGLVAESPHWLLTVLSDFDVPGWYVFQSRRHVVELTELSADALSSLGPKLAEAVSAIQVAVGCEKVYIQRFGEKYQHWHSLVLARPESVEPSLRGSHYFLGREHLRDDHAAATIVRDVVQQLSGWRLECLDRDVERVTRGEGE